MSRCGECRFLLGDDDPSPCMKVNKQKTQWSSPCEKYRELTKEDNERDWEDVLTLCQKVHSGRIAKRSDAKDEYKMCPKCFLRDECL